jgi:hypothetical protein
MYAERRHELGCDLGARGKPCVQAHPIYSTGANEPVMSGKGKQTMNED